MMNDLLLNWVHSCENQPHLLFCFVFILFILLIYSLHVGGQHSLCIPTVQFQTPMIEKEQQEEK